MKKNEISSKLNFEDFCDINFVELNCIFAETGIDRENDFCLEEELEKIYFNPNIKLIYPQLVFEHSV